MTGASVPAGLRAKRRLLVIDDSLTIRKLVELSLKTTDWITEFAASGLEGIAKATASVPDVILLDFVLPDMRGTDVCAELARDARTSWTPVLVMSAKQENVRELFQAYPAVADFIGKPFKAQEILSRIDRIASPEGLRSGAPAARASSNAPPRSAPRTSSSSNALFSFQQREATAQAMYAKFRPLLAQIPELMAGLGSSAPAPYFARKLLTPALMEDLLAALLPTLKEALGRTAEAPPESRPSSIYGELGTIGLVDLFEFLGSNGQHGELELVQADQRLSVRIQGGAITAVTRVASRPPHAKAEEAHDARRLLLAALSAPSLRFWWRPSRAPAEAQAPPTPAISLAQLALEQLRAHEPERPAAGAIVFERAEGFSRKVTSFELSDAERRVLTLVDGRSSVLEVAGRAALRVEVASAVCDRLERVELIQRRPAARELEAARPVLVVDPDLESFQRPLEKLLAERAAPVALVGVGLDEELLGAIQREQPSLVILNATALGSLAKMAARAVRAAAELRDLPLVAVLEAPAWQIAEELAGVGFDAVLTKPVLFSDLEKLLVA
jgi:CheY-like chemotaxis protein